MLTRLTGFAIACSLFAQAPSDGQAAPTIHDVVSLKRPSAPAISPDGRHVAFVVRQPDWTADVFRNEVWLSDVETRTVRPLASVGPRSYAPRWAGDGRRLAFLSDRDGKPQVYSIDPFGGEAIAVTRAPEGVDSFEWSPDGSRIAYTTRDARPKALEERDHDHGAFEIVGEERVRAHLFVVDPSTGTVRRLTEGAYSIEHFSWSPNGTQIAFDHRPDRDMVNVFDADISVVTVSDGTVRDVVSQAGLDEYPIWSPDGRQLAFLTTAGNPDSLWDTPTRIATVPAAGGPVELLTTDFEENPYAPRWSAAGIYFWSFERASQSLYLLDPTTRTVSRVGPPPGYAGSAFSFNRDFSTVAYLGSDARSYAEIYVAPVRTMNATRVTDFGRQVSSWPQATREIVQWVSPDGTPIEGVLHKPSNFHEGTRYPLLVMVHGGPTTAVLPAPYSAYDPYPIDQFLNQGALVLQPNYRGSIGYGSKFRSLNVRNLGVGDAADVLAGVDYLIGRGLVDRDRVGTMGWSQGGHISAFLATHDSTRFKAVSVGAGISDWTTYYANTDLHQFTRHFLQATPWDDPDVYARTSPITYIKQARTPTLIQHGGQDPRVPIANAYLLYQGLKDQGVTVRLIVYKGFGHELTKPKAFEAAMEHNLAWFNQFIWNKPAADSASR